MIELNIPVEEGNEYKMLIGIYSFIPPFSKLSRREKQLLSHYLHYNHMLSYIPEDKRNKLIFDYDTRTDIAQKLEVNLDNLYNIHKSLKKKGFIESNGKEDVLVQKYIIPFDKTIKFNLV